MTDSVRQAAKHRLLRLGLTQAELAGRVGVSPEYLSRLLSGSYGGSVNVWRKILDELGLELVARPKGNQA